MKNPQFFFGKLLLVFLAFFSQAGTILFAFPSESTPSEEKTETYFVESNPVKWVFDQIENYGSPESYEKITSGYGKTNPCEVTGEEKVLLYTSNLFITRDLRAAITHQIFPSHFFL